MGKLYENPPIVEALCEFRFEPGQPWDWTIPGLVYSEVRAEFPKKRQQNILQIELNAEQEEIAQSVKGGIARMQFLRDDEKVLIQVGPDLLVANHLKPYPTWQVFKEMITKALSVYCRVAHPKSTRRIGLRYINRIETPEPVVTIEDYLLALPQVPAPTPQVFASWVQRVEIPFEHVNGLLVLQSGSIHQGQQAKTAFMLDLDFSTLPGQTLALDLALEWVERAHNEIERTFEACITDKARALFKEVHRDQ